jgi:hypothetical protein
VLQGLRKVGEMAGAKVLGAMFAAVAGIGVILIMGIKGIPAYLLFVTGGGFLASWLFARRHRTGYSLDYHAAPPWRQWRKLVGIGSRYVSTTLRHSDFEFSEV